MVGALAVGLVTYRTPKVLMVLVVLVVLVFVSVDLDQQLQMSKLLLVDWVAAVADWLLLTHGSVATSGGTLQQCPRLGAS